VFSRLFRRKKGSQGEPLAGPRRRQHLRHPCALALQAKCSSWSSFRSLFSQNISERGLYIPTPQSAEVGEAIVLELHVPDGEPLKLAGVVVHIFRGKGKQGLGIRLEALAGAERERYRALVAEAARQTMPRVQRPTGVYDVDIPSQPSRDRPRAGSPEPDSGEIPIFEDTEAVPAVGANAAPPLRDGRPPPPPNAGVAARAATEPMVGIDFGTSMSCVAVVMSNEVLVLQLGGRSDLPSIVGFVEDGRTVVGHDARQLLLADPRCAIASPKRLLGRSRNDREIEPCLAGLAVPHATDDDGCVLLQPHGRRVSVPQACAPVLRELRLTAEQHLGRAVKRVVLTCPVSFDERRLAALREAARLAGLEVLRFVDEPTAAALAYRFDPAFRDQVAIYDFGGGTFDFSVVDVSAADLQVVATAGDSWLGGDDFDEALAAAAANAFWRETGVELRHQQVQWQRLRIAAEAAKRELSARASSAVVLEGAALSAEGPRLLRFPITRAAFAELSAPIIERSLDTCREALELAGVKPGELSAVFLSGGTSYIPAVREAVAGFFGKPARVSVPPDRAVVIGAAMYAAQALGSRVVL
jgi:actin-like ATPase involved in cell morphogenesis/Tfp pilus assembly protein PilZ